MVTHREILVVRRAGDRSVDVRKPPAVRLVPGPNFRWSIIERGGHFSKLQAFGRAYDSEARSTSQLPLAPDPHQFFQPMSPQDKREHSSSGRHCSVVRLKAVSRSYVREGWTNGRWQNYASPRSSASYSDGSTRLGLFEICRLFGSQAGLPYGRYPRVRFVI